MELLLVRHALPERIQAADGPADPGLTDAGHRQSALLADYLESEPLDAIFTSPLRRARETTAPLAARTGLTPVVVDDVAEYDRSSNEYIPIEELKASGDPRFAEVATGADDGLDDPAEFTERVVGAIEAIIAAHGGRRVAVVCHGGVINAYAAHVLGLDLTVRGFFYPNYTSIHRFAAARSGERSLVTLNETSHLRHSGLPVGLFQKG